ncbi:MAG: hypothetical protein ACRD1Z_21300 [Vicinamibacteria bacterium]
MPRTFIAIPSIGTTDIRFAVSLAALRKPQGTAIASSPRSIPDIARNGLFDQALKFSYDSVFFLDDDMVLDADLLTQLQCQLGKSDPSVAAIAPLAFRRHPPFTPCAFIKNRSGDYKPISDLEAGVIEVDAIHFAATLVRSSWLEKVSPPRFEFQKEGQSYTGEDLVLCEKLKSLGAKLLLDTLIPEALHIGLPPLVGRKAFEMARQAESRLVVP